MALATGKKRPRSHSLGDIGVSFVQSRIELEDFGVNRYRVDYGIDLQMHTVDPATSEFENGQLLFQVKATESVEILPNGSISFTIETQHARFWLGEPYPVILALYSHARNEAFWLDVQQYFRETRPDKKVKLDEQRTINVEIPAEQRLDSKAIQHFRNLENRRIGDMRDGGVVY